MDNFLLEFRLYAMVAFGIGAVIFVHELGHFLAARWCGVRVETFSLGFGPALLKKKRGATTYQLSIVPLGGYVKMAGEESTPGSSAASDELSSKSVAQRFLIFSGGVIMNMVFALIVFPIILMTGVPLPKPEIGDVVPGSPAWQAGLKPGSRVVSVNGNEVFAFMHIMNEIALGPPDSADLVVIEPGSTVQRNVHVVPRKDEDMGFSTIGVSAPIDPNMEVVVAPKSAAFKAGIKTGDRIVEVPGGLPGLAPMSQIMQSYLRDRPLALRLERPDGSRYEATVTPSEGKPGPKRLGLGSVCNFVKDVRPTKLVEQIGLHKDDRILSVNGEPILRHFDLLRALRVQQPDSGVSFVVRRGDERLTLHGPVLSADDALALHHDIALVEDNQSTRILAPAGGSAANAGLRDGDRIVEIGPEPKDGGTSGDAQKNVAWKSVSKFQDIRDANESGGHETTLALKIEREDASGAIEQLVIAVEPRETIPLEYGLDVRDSTYILKASSPIEAVRVGVGASWKLVEESWLTVKRMLLGHVSSKNLGGIITIGVVSHTWAGEGFAKLLFFLCMLSVNLAFLNVLPIPVLDGGHLFFLLVEKIKGSPVSERVLGYSQLVGVVLIVSLMVFVTYRDVVRWIMPK